MSYGTRQPIQCLLHRNGIEISIICCIIYYRVDGSIMNMMPCNADAQFALAVEGATCRRV